MPIIFKKYKENIVKDDNKILKNYEECINNIQNNLFRKKIKDSAFDYLYVYDFKNKLNTSHSIFAFGNKVLDVENIGKSNPFRIGYPHDYLSIKSNLIIPNNISEDLYEKCNNILNKIFPNEDLYEYFLFWCSSLLVPGNQDKVFHVWLGDGNNGKSAIATLLKYTFGEYCVTIPSTAFMKSKSKADAATPHLDLIKNALIVIAQEPDGGVMNVNFMKEMTGNDNIFIRALFQDGKNIQINAKFIMQANKRFVVDNDDFAAWNRFRVLLFQSYFIDDKNINKFIKENEDKIIYNDDNKPINIFPIDKKLNEKLKEIAPAFLMLLIKKLPEYNKKGLPSSEAIMKITQEYRNKMDSFQIFITDNIVKIKDNEYEEIPQYFKYNDNNLIKEVKGISFEKILEIYNEHYKRKFYCNNKTVNIDKVKKTIKRQFDSEFIKIDDIEREFIIGYTIKRKYNKLDDMLNDLRI